MKRVRRVVFCSVAVLAMSAVVAASASAELPEFSGPFPKAYTSKGGATLIETGGIKLTCKASTDVGEVTGAKTGNVMVRLTGCSGDSFPCTSPGAAEGEMVTSKLATTLGYIDKAKHETGIALAASGAPFDEMECAGLLFVVEGSVIGKVTPINKSTKSKPKTHFKLTFSQKKGVQKPRKLEGEPVDVLEGHIASEPGLSLEAGLKTKDEITLAEAGEIKA